MSAGLRVSDLSIFSGKDSHRRIAAGISFEVRPGEALGLVGESGSGKSLTARAIVGLLPRGVTATGRVELGDEDLMSASERRLRGLRGERIAMLLQDPFSMLDPLMTAGRHVAEGTSGPRSARRGEVHRRLKEVGIGDERVADRYPFELSGGLRQRVALAAALAGDPDVLIADEPSTALDASSQREIMALLRSIQVARQMSVLLITHDLRDAFDACDRLAVLYAGRLVEIGPTAQTAKEPLHPYTAGLIGSEPPADQRIERLPAIPGSVPRFDEVAGICGFAPRCRWARPECRAAPPPLQAVGDERASACVRLEEIRGELLPAEPSREGGGRDAERPATPDGGILVVDGLVKRYPATGGHEDFLAVDGATLSVAVGQSVGVVGESGSGKTTLARCVMGLTPPTEGTITIAGIDASRYEAVEKADLRRLRRTVQLIFQDPYMSLNPRLSIGSALREGLALVEDGEERHTVGELLDLVGLPAAYVDLRPAALSGGERQRVAIARALAVKPSLIVCDEPVSALDVSVQAQVLNLLNDLRRELDIAYLFITHDLAVVRQVTEQVHVMTRGRIVESGPVDQVLDRPVHEYTRALMNKLPARHADEIEPPRSMEETHGRTY